MSPWHDRRTVTRRAKPRSAARRRCAPSLAATAASMALLGVGGLTGPCRAQSESAFTYQAVLRMRGSPVTGAVDLRFSLYDASEGGSQVGSTQNADAVVAEDGRLSVELDFGVAASGREPLWLEAEVRSPAGSGSFTTLAPRQLVASTPSSIRTRGLTVSESGEVGVGTVPQSRLDVSVPGELDTTETAVMMGVSDSGDDYLEMRNATGDDGQFIALLRGHHGSTGADALRMLASTTPEQDDGSQPLLDFGAWRSDGTALTAPIVNRPLFGWNNGATRLMTLDPLGRLGLGTAAPVASLHILSPRPVIAMESEGTQSGILDFAPSGAFLPGSLILTSSMRVENTIGDLVLAPSGEVSIEADVELATMNPYVRFVTDDSWEVHAIDGDVDDLELASVGPGQDADFIIQTDGSIRFEAAGELRAEITKNSLGAGLLQLYGPEWSGIPGERAVTLGTTGASGNHGLAGVCDESGTIEAEMYVDSNGDGIVIADVITADTKLFRIPHPRDPASDIVFACVEGPEAAAYARGTGQLVDGRAGVELPSYFRDVAVSDGMTVQVTPRGLESKGLAVVARSVERFEVRELFDGRGTYAFDWEVTAVRRGFEDYRVIRPRGNR